MPTASLTPLSHAQIREVLSSGAASRFFEEWSEASRLRSEREERLEDLTAQGAVAAARVRLAEDAAERARARAEEARRRGMEPGLAPSLRPFVQLESTALASLYLARAEAATLEASERENRAAALADEASRLTEDLRELERQRESLRQAAAALSGYVGESCLFFADATVPGGAWVVPLQSLSFANRELTAFVLHRLAPGAPLSDAVPVRDAPTAERVEHSDQQDDGEGIAAPASRDSLEPPREHPAGTSEEPIPAKDRG